MDVLAYPLAQQLCAEHLKLTNSNNCLEIMRNINICLHSLNKQQLELSFHQW